MNDDDDEGPTMSLVMPFVVCSSAGGLYDDAAFVAGYDLGILDTLLEGKPAALHRTMRTASLPQVDLIAMKHGYTVRYGDADDDEWTFVECVRPAP